MELGRIAIVLGVLGCRVHLSSVEVLGFSVCTLFPHLSSLYLYVWLNHSTSSGCWGLERIQGWCGERAGGRCCIWVVEATRITSCAPERYWKKHWYTGLWCPSAAASLRGCFGFLGKSAWAITVEVLVSSVTLRTPVPRKMLWSQTTQWIRLRLD